MATDNFALCKAKEQDLTADQLRELVHYDPDTGEMRWLKPRSNRIKVGDLCGWTMSHGYRGVFIAGEYRLVHRLAWLYMTGEWPEYEVDHVNRDKSDNRWVNLRLASHTENSKNGPRRSHNRSGLKGITEHRDGRWKAQIMLNRRQIYLGLFATKEDAHKAYCEASAKYHGTFGSSGDIS
jgi:hypothetical protein